VTAAVHASDYTTVTPERGWVQPGAAHVQVPNLSMVTGLGQLGP
jgi:hypothetical protein